MELAMPDMPDNWAGVAVLIAVQVVIFFFTKRSLDRLDKSISRLEKTLAETKVELAAQITAFKEDLLEQMATNKAGLLEELAAMNNEPPPCCCVCCNTNPRCTAAPKNRQTR